MKHGGHTQRGKGDTNTVTAEDLTLYGWKNTLGNTGHKSYCLFHNVPWTELETEAQMD